MFYRNNAKPIKQVAIFAILLLALVTIWGCDDSTELMHSPTAEREIQADAFNPDGEITAEASFLEDDTVGQGMPAFFTIDLENGNRVSFYEIEGTIGVLEEAHLGNSSLTLTPEVIASNALEIFNAVSPSGTPIPREIINAYGDQPKLGPQGWLREQLLAPAAPPLPSPPPDPCDPAQFELQLLQLGFDKTALLIHERPADHPGRWNLTPWTCEDGAVQPFYKSYAQVSNVDKFYTAVAVCFREPRHCDDIGPEIIFRYQDATNKPGVAAAFMAAAAPAFYHWIWSGNDWDWFTQIRKAMPHDEFNIGLTWSK